MFPRDIVCLRNISINTLHKGGDGDDDDDDDDDDNIISNRMVIHGQDSSRSEQGQVTGCCEHGVELLVSIKYGEFLE